MSFHRLSLIIGREYLSTVGKRSFLLLTVLMPVLVIALCALPALLAEIKSDDVKNVAVLDATGRYSRALQDTDEYHFYTLSDGGARSARAYYESDSGRDVYAIVSIPASVDSLSTLSVYSPKSVPQGLSQTLSDQLEPLLREARIEAYGIDSLKEIMAACDVRLEVENIKWDESGEEQRSEAFAAQMLGLLLSLLTYMFVLCYGAMIMNGVIEEKTNRIVEVIVSSCRPMELMLGKIVGVALVGLTQIAIWGVLVGGGLSLLGLNAAATASPEVAMMQSVGAEAAAGAVTPDSALAEVMAVVAGINWAQMLGCFLLYFVGGYLLYAALFAAFGSAVDQPSDASQFTMPIVMILIFALYAGMYSINNPDGPLAWWCSMIPFTSPIVMMIRLPYDVPTWEVALSLLLLFATAFATVYLAGRIYRTGILMYGKKTSLKELLRWLR
jgi:ABC-2 type transport system permease protein